MAKAERGKASLELKVGLFVLIVIAAGLAVVVVLGQKRHVFERRVTLHARFTDVQGLREGAPVWLSGVSVGTVGKISFGRPGEKWVHVDIEISRRMLAMIHEDSVASIGSQGLLGDKIVQISLGGPGSPPLEPGGELPTRPPADLNKVVEQATETITRVREIADNVAVAMRELANPETIASFHASLKSVRALLHQAERGPGLVHSVFYDKRTARKVEELASTLDTLAGHVDRGVQSLDKVLSSIDSDGRQVVNNLSRAARSVGETAGEIDRSRIVAHLDQASGDLAAITHHIRSGRGTIGALIVDPTVYEQLVTILGGVNRSRVLRWAVRYAIRRREKKAGKPQKESLPLPPKTENRAKR